MSHPHHGTHTSIIALTPGEPAGIGPDLTVMAAQQGRDYPLVAICDPQLLIDRAQKLGLPLKVSTYSQGGEVTGRAHEICVLPVHLAETCEPGTLNQANAQYVLDTLKQANDGCLSGAFAAVVTGPVQKSIINEAGIPFSGHTEYFAENSHTPRVVMMLATEGLRVALATTHLPLKDVSAAITQESLTETINILLSDLQLKFGLSRPKVLVCGLNPHAGEGGHLGMEEIHTITPVLESFRKDGHALIGPLPADTLFNPNYLQDADAVLAMYHDQGLPVLKYKGFGNAVNITLGLPFIRTSVDHGTALDLAGTGKANPGSLGVALNYAKDLAAQHASVNQIASS